MCLIAQYNDKDTLAIKMLLNAHCWTQFIQIFVSYDFPVFTPSPCESRGPAMVSKNVSRREAKLGLLARCPYV